jgi:hypothetical protein
MPALVAGIHVLNACNFKGVDGRDKPGMTTRIGRPRHSLYNLLVPEVVLLDFDRSEYAIFDVCFESLR